MISKILHVYQGMVSSFTDYDEIFANFSFPTELIDIILNAWDGERWNLVESNITAGHFGLLEGFYGIDSGTANFAEPNGIVYWFNRLRGCLTSPSFKQQCDEGQRGHL